MSIEWDGKDLPPVGTVCEIEQSGEWSRVQVMYLSNCTLLLRFDGDEENDNEGAFDPLDNDINLRPIRTHDQIAAEEREAEIIEIERIAISGENSGKTWASAVYDAGYRKQ